MEINPQTTSRPRQPSPIKHHYTGQLSADGVTTVCTKPPFAKCRVTDKGRGQILLNESKCPLPRQLRYKIPNYIGVKITAVEQS